MIAPLSSPKTALLCVFIVCASTCGAAEEPATDVETLYRESCSRCHGEKGEGAADGYSKPFRAGQTIDEMARVITETMPEDDPESCVGEDAKNLAAFILASLATSHGPETPRISRLTVDQYRNAIADVIGSFPLSEQADAEVEEDPEYDRQDYLFESEELDVPGLRGDYFQSRGSNKADRLGFYRTDLRMEFDFGSGPPVPSLPADQFTIIWRGSLNVQHTGFYEFRIRSANGARLHFNHDPFRSNRKLRVYDESNPQDILIDAWVSSGKQREKSARIFLLGGRRYPMRLEFFKYLEDEASVTLEWKPPQGVWSVLDYNHTTTAPAERVFVSTAAFPADDRSLGFERGTSVSAQWQDAVMNGAIEAANEVVRRLPHLSGVSLDEEEAQEQDRVALARELIVDMARRAYRRPLQESERDLLLEFVGQDESDFEAGVKRAVVLIFMSPHFLYPDLSHGAPSPYAVASRLSFAIWDSIPDAALLRAAAAGELATSEQIQSQAERMLEDVRSRDKVRRLFRAWLELEDRDLAKDKTLFPEFDEAVIADLRRSLELFIDGVVWSRESDYRKLLTADYLILNQRLLDHYGSEQAKARKLDGQEIKRLAARRLFASAFQPVDFPEDQRSGVLTHPYLLSAYAYHNNTSPIHRGVFLTRKIVGRALSPPPIAVAFKDDEFDPDLTMREKITQLTQDTACMSCHSVINPLGFTLEHYDAVGRWRSKDNQKPVDSKSEYTTASGETLQLSSARDVAEFAIDSSVAHDAFITHVVEQVLRRSPRDVAPDLLDRLRKQFVEDKFNIQKLLAQVAAAAASPPPAPSGHEHP